MSDAKSAMIRVRCPLGHTYVFVFPTTEEGRKQALRTAGRWASDPQLSFSWSDAFVVSSAVRRQEQDQKARRVL